MEKIKNFELEKSLSWNIVKIKKINLLIETLREKGIINFNNVSWTRKNFDEFLKIGDLVYVKKVNSIYELKQLPKVNGAVVVMDPIREEFCTRRF